jgi:PPK2 family polyphosphate:nucleotide phosphotransferase
MDFLHDSAKLKSLKDVPTRIKDGLDRDKAEAETQELGAEMEELFDLLYFAGQNSLLIVLQGMDTAGKDGSIRHLLRFTHAQSVHVPSFKVPTEEELAYDFLWRVHKQAPRRGDIAIFNRSHYEDVLVVRVRELEPESVWRPRYEQINSFESLLTASGTIILKVFLHISKDEQEERLLDREKEVEKSWKLSAGDWKERTRWDDYQEAYAEAIRRTATPEAPWLVLPADQKWRRNLELTRAVVERLRPYRQGWMERLEAIGKAAKAELAEYRQSAQG